MATIRKTFGDGLDAASSLFTAGTKSVRSVSRMADAGYAKADAFATRIEAAAEWQKHAAPLLGKAQAAQWLTEQRQAIDDALDTPEKRTKYLSAMDELTALAAKAAKAAK